MLPTDEEIQLESCCSRCKRCFFRVWNCTAVILWGGFFAAFYMLRMEQIAEQNCPQPWHMFFLCDTAAMVVYYLSGFFADCCTDKYGDTRPVGRKIHVMRLCICLPYSFIWWCIGVAWLVEDIECLNFEAVNRPWGVRARQPFVFIVTAAAYLGIRMFQNYITWLILCLQCCALNNFRKQELVVEMTEIKAQKQAVAASHTVQNWSVIVGIKPLQLDTLVGYGAAENYRRRKRDLEEGYLKYKNRRRPKWRRQKVVHVQTHEEHEEEIAEASRKSKPKTVFPFMRMTNVVRDSDVTLENPFQHLGQGTTDLVAANKAAKLVEKAATNVAARLGAEHVGVAARRGM